MSATPQPNCIHRTSLPSRSTACTTPFPCKRRVVLWGLDRQEWLRFSTCTAPQRLHCEYTDKQPAHNAGEETQGADDSALSTGNIDKQGVDHGEIHSTDHNRDAHPQVRRLFCHLCGLEAFLMRPTSGAHSPQFIVHRLYTCVQVRKFAVLRKLQRDVCHPLGILRADGMCRARMHQETVSFINFLVRCRSIMI